MKSIFVSSTFKDMQYERDLLNKYIAPKIREIAKQYKKDVFFTDLRWGVNTENLDSDRGAQKVLEVCFDEILKCNPYILVFIGERYGWIPDKHIISETTQNYNIEVEDEMSVTELEIQFGALQQKDLEHCIFCFRDKFNEEKLTEEQRKVYLAEDDEHKQKLNKLKQKILDKNPPHVIYYNGELDENGKMKISENFEKEIVTKLEKIMKKEWGNQTEKPWQQEEVELAKFYIKQKNSRFVGREELLQKYIKQIKSKKDYFYILQGEQGTGKSSILCKMYEELVKDETLDVFPFISANSNKSSNVTQLINQLNYFLASKIEGVDMSEIEGDKFALARDIFINLMNQYKEKINKTLVILVDGVDELFRNQICLDYEWAMPLENQTIFATMTPQMPLPKKHKYALENLPLLENTETIQVIKSICEKEHKQLSEAVTNEIIKLPNSKNPLYLQMVLQRLMMMDENDFANIKKQGDNMEAINKTQIELIHSIPNDLPGVCEFILKSACKHIGTEVARDALFLIALVQDGLTRKEIREILTENNYEWNELEFASLIRYMKNCFSEKVDGRIDFSHKSIKQGFLEKIEDKSKYQNMIFEYIEKLDITEPLKISWYITFAFLTGNIEKVVKCAHKLMQENKLLESCLLAQGFKSLMDSSHEVHIDFVDTIIDTTMKTKDIKFIETFLLDYFTSQFMNEEHEVEFIDMVLELAIKYFENNELFEQEDLEYIMTRIVKNLVITKAKLRKFDEAKQYFEIYNATTEEVQEEKVHLYRELGDSLYESGKFKEAIENFQIAVEITKKLQEKQNNKETHILLAKMYTVLASAYQGIMRRKESRIVFEKAEKIYEKVLEKYNEELSNEEIFEINNRQIEIKMDVGDLYVSDGEYEKGEQILKETLEMNKKNVKDNKTPQAELFYCNNFAKLGYLYRNVDPELSKENYERCSEILELLEVKYPSYQRYCELVREDMMENMNIPNAENDGIQSIIQLYQEIDKAQKLAEEREEPRYKEELIKKYEQLLKIIDKKNKLDLLERILVIYVQLDKQNTSRKYRIGMAEYYSKIGMYYYDKRKWRKAKEYLEIGYDLLKGDKEEDQLSSLEEIKVLVPNTTYLGTVLMKKRKYESATDIFWVKNINLINISEQISSKEFDDEIDICMLHELIPATMKSKDYNRAMTLCERFIKMKCETMQEDEDMAKIMVALELYKKCTKKTHQKEKFTEMQMEIFRYFNE